MTSGPMTAGLLVVFLPHLCIAEIGQPPTPFAVRGSCPAGLELERQLAMLVSDAGKLRRATIVVTDRGVSFEALVARDGDRQKRVFPDDKRDCGERAHVAAVWIAMTLDPPQFGIETPPIVAAPPTVAIAPPPKPSRRVRLDLAASALFEAAPIDGAWTGGAGISVLVGSEHVQLHLGIAALSPGSASDGAYHVSLVRFPVDAGIRASDRLGRVELAGLLGVALVPVWATATDAPVPQGGLGVDVGVRAGFELGLRATERVRPVVSFGVTWVPVPATLELRSLGSIGTTPSVWAGAAFGVAFKIL
jgi:hypothetical protein